MNFSKQAIVLAYGWWKPSHDFFFFYHLYDVFLIVVFINSLFLLGSIGQKKFSRELK